MDLSDLTNNMSFDIDKSTPYKCEECGSEYFQEVVCMRKFSKLLTGAAEDTMVPMKTYRCADCKHINKDFKID